ncbi:hybrid sensor histidine kinase/response regulator [Colwelliaceae bacterium 6441]
MRNGSFSSKDNSLLKTQFDILFTNSSWLIPGQLLLSSTITFWLYGQVASFALFTWYGLTFIPPLYRAYLSKNYQQVSIRPINYWKNRYLIGSFTYALVWGSLVFFELPLINFYFILFILSGYIVVTVSASSVYLPAVTYFVLPVGALISFRCLMLELSSPEQGWSFTLLIVVFSITVILLSARALNRSIVAGLKVRFENIELIESLKEQKAAVEAAKETAEKANQDKSRFLAAASHDLRQPLHAMSLFLDAIRHCDEKEERLALYRKLDKSVESLGELFNALLDISKIDAQVIDIQPTTFYITDTIKKVVNEFELEANKKNIVISYRASTLKVCSDPLWFERIIRNLVSNAVRYTDSGKILVTCKSRGDKCVVQIWDTGQGIAKDQQETIFQEFTQLHNSQRDRSNGLGLGLAIVQRLCHLLDHQIELKSVMNKGSVFSLTLPLSTEQVMKDTSSNMAYEVNSLKNKTVLVIDDEPDVRMAMKAMLAKWGCHVFVADSLAAVFTMLDEQDTLPTLIISDYRLDQEQTGLETLIAINQRYSIEFPAILVTGETETNTIRKINESGYKVLHKPVKPAKLRLTMNSLLNQTS